MCSRSQEKSVRVNYIFERYKNQTQIKLPEMKTTMSRLNEIYGKSDTAEGKWNWNHNNSNCTNEIFKKLEKT